MSQPLARSQQLLRSCPAPSLAALSPTGDLHGTLAQLRLWAPAREAASYLSGCLCLPRPPLRLQIWLLELAVWKPVDSLTGSWVMNLRGHSCLLSLYNVEALGIQG